jgi:hypothetical protein
MPLIIQMSSPNSFAEFSEPEVNRPNGTKLCCKTSLCFAIHRHTYVMNGTDRIVCSSSAMRLPQNPLSAGMNSTRLLSQKFRPDPGTLHDTVH